MSTSPLSSNPHSPPPLLTPTAPTPRKHVTDGWNFVVALAEIRVNLVRLALLTLSKGLHRRSNRAIRYRGLHAVMDYHAGHVRLKLGQNYMRSICVNTLPYRNTYMYGTQTNTRHLVSISWRVTRKCGTDTRPRLELPGTNLGLLIYYTYLCLPENLKRVYIIPLSGATFWLSTVAYHGTKVGKLRWIMIFGEGLVVFSIV